MGTIPLLNESLLPQQLKPVSISIDGAVVVEFSPLQILELYNNQEYDHISVEFIRIALLLKNIPVTEVSTELTNAFNSFVTLLFTLLSKPDFTFSNETYTQLLSCHDSFALCIALSAYETSDIIIEKLLPDWDTFALAIILLYNAGNRLQLDTSRFFDISPQIGSLWWSMYWLSSQISSPVGHKNLLDHFDRFNDRYTLYGPDAFNGYFDCSYLDSSKEYAYKRKLHGLIEQQFSNITCANIPDPKSIAIVSGKWIKGHAVYKSIGPLVETLRPKYRLTLVNLAQDSTDVVTSSFDKVISVRMDNGRLPLGNLQNNDFSAAFFPDIGMNLESILLANCRIAPLQITGYGHPVSTGGAQIDYFIGGSDVEHPQKAPAHYSERLVLIPGLGAHLVAPDIFISPAAERNDACVINCSWGHAKINSTMLLTLREIRRQSKKPVFFLFYPSGTLDTGALFLVLKKNIENVLGKNTFRIIRNKDYADYMSIMATGTFNLDSYPFGGYNTILDALFIGKPVVAWRGNQACNRLATSLLEKLELSELVAENQDEYVGKAVRLVHDKEYRTQLVGKIRAMDIASRLDTTQDPSGFRRAIDYLLANHEILSKETSRSPIFIS